MAPVVRCPEVVVIIDSQSVRVCEQTFPNAAEDGLISDAMVSTSNLLGGSHNPQGSAHSRHTNGPENEVDHQILSLPTVSFP